MTNIIGDDKWESHIYQLEYTDPVLGGTPSFNGSLPVAGYANVATQQLANRLQHLRVVSDSLTQTLVNLEGEVNNYVNTLNDHIGSGVNAHMDATQQQSGFLSLGDKKKVDSLSLVATDSNYNSLIDKPKNINYTVRTVDFVAERNTRYFCTSDLMVTLPYREDAGLKSGDSVILNKIPTSTTTVSCLGQSYSSDTPADLFWENDVFGGSDPINNTYQFNTWGAYSLPVLIRTVAGDTQLLTYDVTEEIFIVFDGNNWNVL